MDDDIRENAIHFEAVKLAVRQNQSGWVVTLAVHPHDAPDDLLTSNVGSRWMVGMAMLNDQSEPVAPPKKLEQNKSIAKAGTLCRNERFQFWLGEHTGLAVDTEEKAAHSLCFLLGINSRKDLRDNKEAVKKFDELVSNFEADRESGLI